MNFFEAFESIKQSVTSFDSSKFNSDFAIQLTITNKDCGGIFYIEFKNGTLNIEPYNYYDNNVGISAGYADLCKTLSGKLALTSPKLNIIGNSEILSAFISATEFKTAEKPKVPARKCTKKVCSEKTEAKDADIKKKRQMCKKAESSKKQISKSPQS